MDKKYRKKNYLSKREKAGTILFLCVCYAYTFNRHFNILNTGNEEEWLQSAAHIEAFEKFKKSIDSLSFKSTSHSFQQEKKQQYSLENFDPNVVHLSELLDMGIPKHVATAMVNYRKSGGTFKTKESLRKVYGMSETLWKMISPYVHVSVREETIGQVSLMKDLNAVNYYDLIRSTQLSNKQVNRIINYRTLLGGYVNMNQLHEVYGFNDSIVKLIQIHFFLSPNTTAKKIKINNADFKTMLRHPYISRNLAKAIISYREMHGPFDTVEKVKNIHLITDSIYSKLAPYISVYDTLTGTEKKHSQHSGLSHERDSI